jgi:hypothetical protein
VRPAHVRLLVLLAACLGRPYFAPCCKPHWTSTPAHLLDRRPSPLDYAQRESPRRCFLVTFSRPRTVAHLIALAHPARPPCDRSPSLAQRAKVWQTPFLFRVASEHLRLGNRSLGPAGLMPLAQIMAVARKMVSVRSHIGSRPRSPLVLTSRLPVRLAIREYDGTATSPHAERAGECRLSSNAQRA